MTSSDVASRVGSLVLSALDAHRALALRSVRNVGVDVVDIETLARLIERGGDRLAARFYTWGERNYCAGDPDRLATTLAGKEAVAKALGTGIRGGVRWTDIEILREPTGAPCVALTGTAAARAREQSVGRIALSLCHEPPVAVAVAVALSREVDQ
jgi:holo-[acyl-carrier protein] synthase